jgi:hypothetical protein
LLDFYFQPTFTELQFRVPGLEFRVNCTRNHLPITRTLSAGRLGGNLSVSLSLSASERTPKGSSDLSDPDRFRTDPLQGRRLLSPASPLETGYSPPCSFPIRLSKNCLVIIPGLHRTGCHDVQPHLLCTVTPPILPTQYMAPYILLPCFYFRPLAPCILPVRWRIPGSNR